MKKLLAVGALCLPGLAMADALAWLQRMNDAVKQSTYSGVAVYRNGQQLDTLRVFHRWHQGREQERMFSLSGEPREVIRLADQISAILPEQRAVLINHQGLGGLLPKLSRTAFEKLHAHYQLSELSETQRIAGRVGRGVRVAAKDGYRYNYELWLDEKTALPLDIRLLNSNNELLEQVVFTQIEYPETLPDQVFEPGVDTTGFRRVSQDPGGSQLPPSEVLSWEMSELPEGFRLANRRVQHVPGLGQPIAHLLYTDGLAAVSVFTTPQSIPEQALEGLTRLGGVNAFGMHVQGYHVTVVGEVPQATVRFFGQHLRRIDHAEARRAQP